MTKVIEASSLSDEKLQEFKFEHVEGILFTVAELAKLAHRKRQLPHILWRVKKELEQFELAVQEQQRRSHGL